jgi:Rrf2 family protein
MMVRFMKLSKKTDYALRVLFSLMDHRGEGPVSMSHLAKSNDVPKRFLEHIMLDLKEQGWVASSPGCKGGYELAQTPDRITLGQVVRHFDGLMAPIGCLSMTRNEHCTQSYRCRFRRVLLEIRNHAAHLLDNTTLAQIADNKPVAEHEVFALELLAGDGI